uniref:Uncharacterized protein n=1 Tax=Solanum tuberosum TaxID=4113 RepID=M1BQ41_SOLTU
MATISPKVPVCKALKEKIKLARATSSRRVDEWFRDALERVNPSPFPTHSARESEWVKAEAVLHAATRCSRETDLIRGGGNKGWTGDEGWKDHEWRDRNPNWKDGEKDSRRVRRPPTRPPLDSRPIYIGVCKTRRPLEIIGESPIMSAISGNYWRIADHVGDLWKLLANRRSCRRSLEIIGESPIMSAISGNYWRIADHVGDLWKLLANRRSCRRSLEIIGESPIMSAISTETAI